MIKNNIKIALRNIKRNKVVTAINITGLGIGIATCLIIMLFVQHEWSYDRYNEKADRMVRVVLRGVIKGEPLNEANVMPPVAQTLLEEFPRWKRQFDCDNGECHLSLTKINPSRIIMQLL